MGFSKANPHQLAPTVGKTQVGVMISTIPSSATSSALDISMARAESEMFGSLGFIEHLPILWSIFADLRTGVDFTFGGYQIYVNRWGTLRLTDRFQSPAA